MVCTSFRAIVIPAVAVAMVANSANALSSYLTKIPNGSSFSQELGHPDNDSSQYTDFANAFAAAGHEWTAELCAATFPGSTMTNGAAFGDPCCTWTAGGTPDFTVTAFTTSPTEATTCASSTSTAGSTTTSTASSGSAATEAPAATTAAPAATEAAATDAPAATEAPSSSVASMDSSAAETPAVTDAPAATEAPSVTFAPATSSDSSFAGTVKPAGGMEVDCDTDSGSQASTSGGGLGVDCDSETGSGESDDKASREEAKAARKKAQKERKEKRAAEKEAWRAAKAARKTGKSSTGTSSAADSAAGGNTTEALTPEVTTAVETN